MKPECQMMDVAVDRARRGGLFHSTFDMRHSFVSARGGSHSCIRAFILAATLLFAGAAYAQPAPPAPSEVVIDLDARFGDLMVERTPEGYRMGIEGGPQGLTPEEFAGVIHREKQWQEEAGFLFVIFNITTWWGLLWISVGLLGQLLFTFRMVLQWLASEKQHKSVVPVGFWWGSLLGGLMLLTYFVWRKDAIGILGQSTGAFIYARNLWLIYFGQKVAETPSLPEKAAAGNPPPANPDTANAHA